jgi:hypothetical protein
MIGLVAGGSGGFEAKGRFESDEFVAVGLDPEPSDRPLIVGFELQLNLFGALGFALIEPTGGRGQEDEG